MPISAFYLAIEVFFLYLAAIDMNFEFYIIQCWTNRKLREKCVQAKPPIILNRILHLFYYENPIFNIINKSRTTACPSWIYFELETYLCTLKTTIEVAIIIDFYLYLTDQFLVRFRYHKQLVRCDVIFFIDIF